MTFSWARVLFAMALLVSLPWCYCGADGLPRPPPRPAERPAGQTTPTAPDPAPH